MAGKSKLPLAYDLIINQYYYKPTTEINVNKLMFITGHTQLKTFLRYLNITPETAGKVANRLDTYLIDTNNSMQMQSYSIN